MALQYGIFPISSPYILQLFRYSTLFSCSLIIPQHPLVFSSFQSSQPILTMHPLFHVFPSLVCLLATSSRATAGVPFKLNHKRQDTATSTSLRPLDILNAALATYPSSITGPLATQFPQVNPVVQKQAAAGTTTGGSSTATSGSSNRGDILVSVEKPSLSSESAIQFSSSYSLPTGTILIQTESGGDGWAEEGSIWSITTSNGVELKDPKVPCAGSACTGINGNKREDGMITQNPDKSW